MLFLYFGEKKVKMKTTGLVLILSLLILNFGVYSQTINNQGAKVIVANGTTLKFQNLINQGTGGYFYYNTDLFVPGYWNNISPAIFNQGSSGKVTFNGTVQQTIRSSGSSFSNVELNNTSGNYQAILLQDNMTVNGVFTLTNGILNTNGNTLVFGNSASSNSGNSNSFVDGKMQKSGSTAFTFPSGNVNIRDFAETAGSQTFVVWSPIRTNPVANTTVEVRYLYDNSGMPDWWEHGGNMDATLHHVSDREFWLVSSTEDFTNVTLYWNDNAHALGDVCVHGFDYADASQFVPSDLTVAYWNGSMWVDADYESSLSNIQHDAGYITSRFVIPFGAKSSSFITYGSKKNQNPLPVELVRFYAECFNDYVDLNWVTASEKSNSGFVVLKSLDLKNWTEIGFVKGQGNSNQLNTYLLSDNKVFGKNYYYRLMQVDFDGKATYSDIVSITCGTPMQEPELIIYPNPTRGNVNLIGGNMPGENAKVYVYSMLGTLVYTADIRTTSGSFIQEINLDKLQPAMYTIKVVCDDFTAIKKLEKAQ